MAERSNIGWTEATWNVMDGCTRISDGCINCYITRTVPFRVERRRFNGDRIGATTGLQFHPHRLDLPLRWRRSRMIFVNSMGDLFHDSVTDELVAEMFAVMTIAHQHTYQVLTKRHARMRAVLTDPGFPDLVAAAIARRGHQVELTWPLPHVWTGVSAESQPWAQRRVPALLDTPGVRWVSAEPLLGPLDLTPWLPQLDWVVVGGESGPGARPMDVDWAVDVVDQARTAGVPVFVKQLGTAWAKTTPAREGGTVYRLGDRKAEDWSHWPANLRVRDYPTTTRGGVTV